MNIKLHLALLGALLLTGCQALQTDSDKHNLGSTVNVVPTKSTHARSAIDRSEAKYPYLWDRIAAEMQMPMPNDPDVIAFRDWYAKHPKYIKSVTERATPFLHLIAEEIDTRDMPMELVLLPIVESAYNPNARSHGNAVGLWQFLSASGQRYGLKQDYWYDGRRDVFASTQAALDYLAQLNAYFEGDWLNAIAAYNAGEGRIQNAIDSNKSRGKNTDFFSLNLPRQTMEYVPRLMALADVIRNADKYGIDLPRVRNHPTVKLIDTSGQVDLRLVAEQANMPLESLKRLNPAYSRTVTSPKGPNHLLVPIEVANDLEVALAENGSKRMRADSDISTPSDDDVATVAQSDRKQTSSAIRYTVKKGDSLKTIAKKFSVSEKDLLAWNKLKSKKSLKNGQTLTIAQAAKSVAKTTSTRVAKNSKHYSVKRGDSLYSIAQRFQISVNDLVRWNDLNHNHLKPGQMLTVRLDNN